jgi:hypothetical protein
MALTLLDENRVKRHLRVLLIHCQFVLRKVCSMGAFQAWVVLNRGALKWLSGCFVAEVTDTIAAQQSHAGSQVINY